MAIGEESIGDLSPMPLPPTKTALNEDELLLVRAAHDFARGELFAKDRAWDVDESSAFEVVPTLGDMGFLSMLLPTEHGGLGVSYRTYASILHELAVFSPSACVTVGVHNMVAHIVDVTAREPLRSEWLASMGGADGFAAFAISEAGAGSDPSSAKAEAHQADGGYRLTGEKMWVTNGISAKWFLILARHTTGAAQGKLSAFFVDGETAGLERTKITGKMGIRGSETAVLALNDVFVPADSMLGEPGGGLGVCLHGLNGGRIGIAAQASGIAEACLFEMKKYANEREQFGQPIGRFQGVGNMLADSVTELEAAKLLIWRAAGFVDRGVVNRSAASMAKLYASETANRVAYRAVQVHGGTGYVHECRVEQLYRDARITSIYEGTSEIQRIVISRDLVRSV